MNWHTFQLKEVFKTLKSSEQGINELEAKTRLKKYGKNQLRKFKTKSIFRMFFSQLNSLLIYILISAAIISFVIGHNIDAAVIMAIVVINSVIGVVQEYKAEEIIEKLRKSLAYNVVVLRDKKQREISSKLLVPGDIVILNEGDKVLSDCRLITKQNLQVDEAILTGESFPVEKEIKVLSKNIVLAERKNMLYAGTTIVKGNCTAIVVDTGINTEFGKLAELVQKTPDEKTPLEKKINSFSKKISIFILAFVIITFFIGIYKGVEKIEMLLVSISLAVGAIPEGLPAIIAITLAVAIKRMYKVNTLIRKLPAAETLGRATIICTDKTGTLTEEELIVDEIYSNKFHSIKDKLNKNLKQILKIGILCNNARDEKDDILGEPTEIALIKAAKLKGLDKKKQTEENTRIKEYAFSSERKMMSIIRQKGNIKTSYVKGAPLVILEKCTKEFIEGKIRLLTQKRKQELEKILEQLEKKGLRVLGFAFRQITTTSIEQAENHLTFTGYMGMIDPPRKEVKEAIEQAIDAGIEIKIITGDSALTTKTIAGKIGLKGETVEGKELDVLNDKQWRDIVRQKTIFARVTPKQKLKIVEVLKQQKQIVAVTGDGVNDILALKRADIGISMGLRGSDVARDSSDMVLLDDNFASIIKAVGQGRQVFDNLKKSIKYLIVENFGEIFLIFFMLLLNFPLPLLPLAILWVNLVTDSLPALALAVEPPESDTMKQKPKKDGLLGGIKLWILIGGLINFICVVMVFYYSLNYYGIEVARTMTTSAIVFFAIFFSFACKSKRSLFSIGILNNKWLIWSVIVSAGLHLIALYTSFGNLFEFVALSWTQLGICILAGLSGLVIFEGWKLVKRN